jgi:uncharacterized heparinase superfamily protein
MQQGFLSVLSPANAGRKIRHLLYASPLYWLTLKGRAPDKLRLTPPSFRLGDPETGRKTIDGTFNLSRHQVTLGKEPWKTKLNDSEQLADLHGFSWLADLYAVGTVESQVKARQLLLDWVEQNQKWQSFSWRPDILGERLSAWLYCFEFISAGDENIRSTLLNMAMIQARHLGRCCTQAPTDARSFKAIQGLIFASVCLPGAESMLGISINLLNREISRQVLPDGGHIERNPSLALALLSRFNQIKALLVAAYIEVPIQLQGAIDRIPPMVRALRLGDGCLAQFNGGYEEKRILVDTVLADTEVRGKALTSAPHSGFQRLNSGNTLIVVDTGKPVRAGRLNSHAGTLSFEMSVGKDRLIVNCGSVSFEGHQWFSAMQLTAAHSTLTVNDLSSSQFDDNGRLLSGPLVIECKRSEAEGAVWLETSHDGFLDRIGIVHRRILYLDASGEDFRGEDIIEGSAGKVFTVRFHLHPSVHASQSQDHTSVLLKLFKGVGWKFQASGGTILLQESIYLNGYDKPRRSNQIVVTGPLHGDKTKIKWRLHKF